MTMASKNMDDFTSETSFLIDLHNNTEICKKRKKFFFLKHESCCFSLRLIYGYFLPSRSLRGLKIDRKNLRLKYIKSQRLLWKNWVIITHFPE